jgi:hypothetical protein
MTAVFSGHRKESPAWLDTLGFKRRFLHYKSSTNKFDRAREQQRVKNLFIALSASQKYESRCSTSPASTPVTQVPHTPSSQDLGISKPAAINTANTD